MTPRAPIRRLLARVAILALAAASPAAAGFDYLTLGDSITQGVCDSGPGVCPAGFCPSGTGSNGYPSRLASSLGCTLDPLPPDNLCGSGCCVVNAGLSSDKTGPMLTRFAAITGTYDVVVIMGGTNDVFGGISNTTIEFNYKKMDNHAVSRGIDPVLSSIIRFRDDVSTPAINATVLDLRNRIQSLAATRNRWFADPWTPLCPNGVCFNQNYYQPGSPDPVGHPNGCGYDIMGGLFFTLINSAALPGLPAASAPTGDITDGTPSLEWTAAANATWHQVEIDAGATWTDLSQLADSCTGSDCSVVSPALSAGSHTWRVRGRNPKGFGAWASRSFELFNAPPPVPVPQAPAGSFFTTAPAEFEWSDESVPVNGARSYDLRILKNGSTIFNGAVTSTCDGSTCTAASPVAMTADSYTWLVRARNPAGASAFSSSLAFEVFPPPAPAQIYPLAEETFDPTPLLRWAETTDVTEYRLEVRNAALSTVWDSGLVSATAVCGGVCEIASAVPLAEEAHSWRVRAKSAVGEGPPSAWQGFTVLDCSAFLDLVLPPPTAVAGTETHKACSEITVGFSSLVTIQGPNGHLTLHAGGLTSIEELTVEAGAELVLGSDP